MGIKFQICFFLVIFLIVFIFTVIMDLIKLKKKKRNKITEINYLVNKFSLNKNKLNYKIQIMIIALLNGIIISTTTTVIALVDVNMTFQLLIGFVMLISLIYSIYEIYGRILKNIETNKKKGSKK